MCEFDKGGGFAAQQVHDKSYCIIFLPSHTAEHDGMWGEGWSGDKEIKKHKDI